jgi:hypothetical protein
MDKLEKLLYRKESTIRLMNIWSKGIKMYSEYIKECNVILKNKKSSKLQKIQCEKDIHESEIPLKHYITSFKQAKMEYENYIIPEIEKLVSEDEKDKIEFKDAEKIAKELAHIEIFGSHSKQPDNVELIKVNQDIEKHINLLENLLHSLQEKINSTESDYEKAKLNLEMFQTNLKIVTNQKRLQERLDYYVNHFKPVYDADMKEAEKYLELYLERARDIIKLGVDIKLGFLLQEYEKNKEDQEKVWLFYTALKSRIKKISKEMRRNKSQFKGKMHLAKDII